MKKCPERSGSQFPMIRDTHHRSGFLAAKNDMTATLMENVKTDPLQDRDHLPSADVPGQLTHADQLPISTASHPASVGIGSPTFRRASTYA